MADVVIKAEKLGKSYLVGHRRPEGKRYVALRDVLARNAHNLVRKTRDMLTGRPVVQGDEVEEFWALKNIDFEVREGEVLGIIGRNGAGKSTLLKVLSRITEPSEGRVSIRGRVASLLEVGTGFHPELTGSENIFLNGAVLGMTRAEIRRKFDEIVAFAEVERFLDTPVKRYSSGMYVRLAFAVAAHLEPEILVIDEVLAVGDAEFQKKCLGKMSEVADHGRTVLFVSHNMNAIERFCRRVLWINHGMLQGSFDDVRTGVSAYLKAGNDRSQDGMWRNNGSEYDNSYFRPELLKVSSEQPHFQTGEPLSNKYAIIFSATGEIRSVDPAFNLGIAVYNDEGLLLFWSMLRDVADTTWPTLECGHAEFRVRLPPRLLNEGDYRVELIGGLHNLQWIFEPLISAPAVNFSIGGGLSDSSYWVVRRPGVLAPVLTWDIQSPASTCQVSSELRVHA